MNPVKTGGSGQALGHPGTYRRNQLGQGGVPTLLCFIGPSSLSAFPTALSQWEALVGGWRQMRCFPHLRPTGESVAGLLSLAPARAPWVCMVPAVWDMGLAQQHPCPLSLGPGVLLGSCGCLTISHLTS